MPVQPTYNGLFITNLGAGKKIILLSGSFGYILYECSTKIWWNVFFSDMSIIVFDIISDYLIAESILRATLSQVKLADASVPQLPSTLSLPSPNGTKDSSSGFRLPSTLILPGIESNKDSSSGFRLPSTLTLPGTDATKASGSGARPSFRPGPFARPRPFSGFGPQGFINQNERFGGRFGGNPGFGYRQNW
uniref:Uncharacterized protein n=1 Tax=Tetranychus urticae TaxID=32264 RepID=T1KUN1_TETUR